MEIETVTAALHPGMVIKNYKVLCSLLKEKEKSGGSKQAQLKEWKRFFNFEKNGHSFLITEIFDSPTPKIDGRSQGNHSLFVKESAHVLLLALSSNSSSFSHSINQWVITAGLANSEYGKRMEIPTLSSIDGNTPAFDDFYDYGAGASVRNYVKSAINHLKKNGLVAVEKKYIAIDKFTDDELYHLRNEYLEDNYATSFDQFIFNQPTDTNRPELLRTELTEDEYLKKKNSIAQELHLGTKTPRERRELFNAILTRNRWGTVHSSITLSLNRSVLPQQYLNATKEIYQQSRQELNAKVYSYLRTKTEERYNRLYDEWQQKIQKELPNLPIKIGKPRPEMTDAYKAGLTLMITVSLPVRLMLVDGLIKR